MHVPTTNRASEAIAARSKIKRKYRMIKKKRKQAVQDIMAFNCKKENSINRERESEKKECPT